MAGVRWASISNENGLLLDKVAALTVCGAWINGMLVVEAFADRVALDDLEAHFEWIGNKMKRVLKKSSW